METPSIGIMLAASRIAGMIMVTDMVVESTVEGRMNWGIVDIGADEYWPLGKKQ